MHKMIDFFSTESTNPVKEREKCGNYSTFPWFVCAFVLFELRFFDWTELCVHAHVVNRCCRRRHHMIRTECNLILFTVWLYYCQCSLSSFLYSVCYRLHSIVCECSYVRFSKWAAWWQNRQIIGFMSSP